MLNGGQDNYFAMDFGSIVSQHIALAAWLSANKPPIVKTLYKDPKHYTKLPKDYAKHQKDYTNI